jgi:outer membrane protein assembly factor BamB
MVYAGITGSANGDARTYAIDAATGALVWRTPGSAGPHPYAAGPIHDTADPEVIVVEYELTGVVTTTGHRATARFISVLRARDGQIVTWREYQDTLAIAQALGQPPP